MDSLIEQVLKIRSKFSHKFSKIIVREILKLGQLDYVYQDRERDLIHSRVIERIFAGLELPPLYRQEDVDTDVFRGDELIIPILKFKSNQLKLEGLDILTGLEGLTYSELPTELQNMFLSYKLDVLEFQIDDMEHIGYLSLHYNDNGIIYI